MSKTCSICGVNKEVEDYYADIRAVDGLKSSCKVCHIKCCARSRSKKREQYREYMRGLNLASRYGITTLVYDEMFSDQKGVCKICKTTCPSGKKLAVDHCHTTGKIRGLLCINCNRGLGHLKDSTTLLFEAIKYLEESDDENSSI